MAKEKVGVMSGNPADGFRFFGVFDTEDEAINFAGNDERVEGDWWLIDIENKEVK